MERLTKRSGNMAWMKKENLCLEPCEIHSYSDIRRILTRLAAYEDTGLEPEQIRALISPPNPPLTLDELRKMVLEDWLWIEILIPSAFRRTKPGYYQIHSDFTKGEALCCGWPGTIFEFEYEDYGKTWLAYRRKPQEGTCEIIK